MEKGEARRHYRRSAPGNGLWQPALFRCRASNRHATIRRDPPRRRPPPALQAPGGLRDAALLRRTQSCSARFVEAVSDFAFARAAPNYTTEV